MGGCLKYHNLLVSGGKLLRMPGALGYGAARPDRAARARVGSVTTCEKNQGVCLQHSADSPPLRTQLGWPGRVCRVPRSSHRRQSRQRIRYFEIRYCFP